MLRTILLLAIVSCASVANAAFPLSWPDYQRTEWPGSYADALASDFDLTFSYETSRVWQSLGYVAAMEDVRSYTYSVGDNGGFAVPYIGPSQYKQVGTVLFHFPIGFAIDSAVLSGQIEAKTLNSFATFCVSVDGSSWTNVATSSVSYYNPIDLTPLVASATDVWVRVQLYDELERGFGYEQVAGAEFGGGAPRTPVFALNVVGKTAVVPEPSTGMLSLVILIMYIAWRGYTHYDLQGME